MPIRSSRCRHPDIRKFDGFRSCLSCGITTFESESIEAIHPSDTDETVTEIQPYRYNKLNYVLGQEIRLLIVEPGTADDPIRCEIITVNLRDNPPYEALSYTWATENGDASPSGIVYCCSGTTIPVTTNCEAAIRRLRKPGLRRRLWIDALCIDQNNITERNHQVSLMKHIYESASRVLVYLDSPHDDFSELITWLRDNAQFCDMEELRHTDNLDSTSMPDSKHIILAKGLLALRWFRRVWVIQEVALARAVRLIVNNSDVLLNEKTVAYLQWMYSWGLPKKVPLPGPLRWTPELREHIDLFACLRATHECSATDARDKVYGILSLLDQATQSLIPVDYSLDLEAVYGSATAAIIAQQGSLDVLAYAMGPTERQKQLEKRFWGYKGHSAGFKTRDGDLEQEPHPEISKFWPSWVPDWRAPRISTLNQLNESSTSPWKSRVYLVSNSGTNMYPAKDPSPSLVHYSLTRNPMQPLVPRLYVRAHFLDTIEQSRATSFMPASKYAAYSRAYWDTVAAQSDLNINPSLRSIFYDGQTRLPAERFPQHLDVLEGPVSRQTYAPSARGMSEVFGQIEPYDEFLEAASLADSSRNVFRTQHSLGFAIYNPKIHVEGDVVVALDGARAPFIMRKIEEGKYRIVCDCYLMAAFEYDGWKQAGGRGPWGELPDPLPDEQRTKMIEIF
ncbi:hypothetical protein N0V90_007588 [Kalmusia sp. IMI 367209]|nr:hypothetical protein N0V90_007588 [Kalmusia sp. IMI 367209]